MVYFTDSVDVIWLSFVSPAGIDDSEVYSVVVVAMDRKSDVYFSIYIVLVSLPTVSLVANDSAE